MPSPPPAMPKKRKQQVLTPLFAKDFMLARDLANDFTRKYLEMKTSGASPEELNNYLNEHSQYRGQHLGDAAEGEICCGQVAGMISEINSARDVMNDIVENICSRFEELKLKIAQFMQNYYVAAHTVAIHF